MSSHDPFRDTQSQTERQDEGREYPEFVWWILLVVEILSWLETRLSPYFYAAGVFIIRWGMVIVFLWFGAIKLHTPPPITHEFTKAMIFLPESFPFWLGVWEMLIGVCFIHRSLWRVGLVQLIIIHMPGTFLPLLILQKAAFVAPMVPALPALYILKNLLFIGGGLVLWYDLLHGEHPTPTEQFIVHVNRRVPL